LFPENEHLLIAEANFRELIHESERAETALERAFAANPRQDFVAIRLARRAIDKEDLPSARTILSKCIDANPGSKRAHLEIAKMYLNSTDSVECGLRKAHLRHAFSEGDSNYDAQFWFARELFLARDYPEAKELFRKLKSSAVPANLKHRIRGLVLNADRNPAKFSAKVVKREETYAIVTTPAFGERLIIDASNFMDDWQKLSRGSEIEIYVGFSMTGAQAFGSRFRN
jgi:tetratricopeptide (TPR) repeat protein